MWWSTEAYQQSCLLSFKPSSFGFKGGLRWKVSWYCFWPTGSDQTLLLWTHQWSHRTKRKLFAHSAPSKASRELQIWCLYLWSWIESSISSLSFLPSLPNWQLGRILQSVSSQSPRCSIFPRNFWCSHQPVAQGNQISLVELGLNQNFEGPGGWVHHIYPRIFSFGLAWTLGWRSLACNLTSLLFSPPLFSLLE